MLYARLGQCTANDGMMAGCACADAVWLRWHCFVCRRMQQQQQQRIVILFCEWTNYLNGWFDSSLCVTESVSARARVRRESTESEREIPQPKWRSESWMRVHASEHWKQLPVAAVAPNDGGHNKCHGVLHSTMRRVLRGFKIIILLYFASTYGIWCATKCDFVALRRSCVVRRQDRWWWRWWSADVDGLDAAPVVIRFVISDGAHWWYLSHLVLSGICGALIEMIECGVWHHQHYTRATSYSSGCSKKMTWSMINDHNLWACRLSGQNRMLWLPFECFVSLSRILVWLN